MIETVAQEGGDVDAAADYVGISPGRVGAAIGYYAAYRSEIDAWIERNTAMAWEAEDAWRRRQAAFQQ